MKKLVVGIVALLLLFGGITHVFAVGSGSGGSVPSCSEDSWGCPDWGPCSDQGSQIRTCTLLFDCPTASTAKPSETQSCTPPVTNRNVAITNAPITNQEPNTNTDQSSFANQNINRNINVNKSPGPSAPLNDQIKRPALVDEWKCGEWQACDPEGNQKRRCELEKDYPEVGGSPPVMVRRCAQLQCGNKANLRDRVRCRLNLAPAGVAREAEIQYLPEECRVIANKDRQQKCVQLYQLYQPCWGVRTGSERFACVRNVLKLGPVVSQEVKTCRGKSGQDQVQCKQEVRDKVFSMIKFRFYDLEERAEELAEEGKADVSLVADFVTLITEKKEEFNKASTNEQRKQIILDVRAVWKEFVFKVKEKENRT